MNTNRVIVVGGGLAGLTAANLLARNARNVLLLEKSGSVGGRASSRSVNGFNINLGPRALYRAGAAARIFRELEIPIQGTVPAPPRSYGVIGGMTEPLPGGFLSLLQTRLLDARGKWEMVRFLAKAQKIDAQSLPDISVQEWLSDHVRSSQAQQLIHALFRLATYSNHPTRQSIRASLGQFQSALRSSVLYIDHGWQTLVDALRRRAASSGVELRTGASAVQVEYGGSLSGIRLSDGSFEPASAVVLAVDPAQAITLVPGCPPDWWNRTPARMACLDVALKRLPAPGRAFAIGIDSPIYFSVHSAWARLAPEGGALIHAGKYLPAGDEGGTAERELENVLDLMQPGWRNELLYRRFLPHLVVTHGIAEAGKRRPGPEVEGIRNLYVAGDWVGAEGLLADAAVASAAQAASLILGNKPNMLAA